jgi:hypothetical protein
MQQKLGYQCPKKLRTYWFKEIRINNTDLHYCESHHFMYNAEEEEKKLHYGQPCYYTDNRFYDGDHNSYKQTCTYRNRKRFISLKTCILDTYKCKGIPKGTIVTFDPMWYHEEHPKMDLNYYYKIEKEKPLDITYEISKDSYKQNFTNCEKSKYLVEVLRQNGFLVAVYPNTNFLMSMIKNACDKTGRDGSDIDTSEDDEIAIAYGFGKKIGFSSFNNSFRGYSNGCDNILWDCYGEFDKWSKCYEISKDTPFEEILAELKTPNDD